MKNYLLLLFIVLLSAICSAQSNYRAGYVINLKGDTSKGFIDYREWVANPDAISFKKNLSEKSSIRYTPADISLFSINGLESYQRYYGKISTDYIDVNHVSNVRDTSYRMAAVFLLVVQKGKNVNFYEYTDAIRPRLYIQQQDDQLITELVYRIYNADAGQPNVDNGYMKQLFALADKYNALTEVLKRDIEHLNYNRESVLDVISQINHISNQQLRESQKHSGNPSLVFFAGAGLNITTTTPASLYKQYGGTSYTSYLPQASVGFDAFPNPVTRKLVFRAEIGINGSKYQSAYKNQVPPYDMINYQFSTLSVTVSPQVKYNFYDTDDFKIFGGAGAEFSFNNYSNALFQSSAGANSNTNDPYAFIKTYTRVILKAGIIVANRWGITASYLTGADLSTDPYFQLSATPFRAGLEYFFNGGKK